MNAERVVLATFVVSLLASLALVVVYVLGGQAQAEGILLAIALGALGTGIVIWAVSLLDVPVEVEERHPLASPPEARTAADDAFGAERITRRTLLVRAMLGAAAALAAALAIPALSLGPQPGRALFRTPWQRGARVVDAEGNPVRLADLAFEAVQTVFPEGHVGSADGATLLIRVRPEDLRLPAERAEWAPEGAVGYSKICTHAGCPVGLYRAEDHQLLCPCHQSTFDVLDGATPTFGPAARPLPQLPLDVDDAGFLVAMDDFHEPIGPSFWNLTWDTPDGPDVIEGADPAEGGGDE